MRKFLFFLLPVLLISSCKSKPPVIEREVIEEVKEIVEVIEVKEPVFEIVSIAIIKSELVNTLFETVLKIENPNKFAVELSALTYELYGKGMLWADGKERNIFTVDAESTLETKFFFAMNFIDMNRRLLDDVIAMREVQYRFKGTAFVRAFHPRARVPEFTMNYDISGMSEVKPEMD